MRFWASDIAAVVGGRLVGGDVELSGATFDSRLMEPGWLFLPTEPGPGETGRDGHDFVAAAVDAGATAVLARRDVNAPCVIRVADTEGSVRAALAAATAHLRSRLAAQVAGRVVGITGSVGKTSTKEFVVAALSVGWRTWGSPRSYNNDWGVPVTVMQAPDDVQALVLEMGMRGFGEIARLCHMAQPHVGVVTAVAEAHTERVGGLEGVGRAKGELVEALPADGLAVLNGDDPRVIAMASRTSARVLTYGEGAHVEVRVSDLRVDGAARTSFTLGTPWGTTRVSLAVPGRHMAMNAAAAVAVAAACGVEVDAAAQVLGSAAGAPGRMTVTRLESGAWLVDDSYNANPRSMRAALDALCDLDATRRVAVVGEMAELLDPDEQHRAIADYAAQRGITLVAVETERYGTCAVPADAVTSCRELSELTADHAVLVKGSRMARLERVVEALRGRRAVVTGDIAPPGQ